MSLPLAREQTNSTDTTHVLLFATTHYVMKTERALRKAGIRHELIPTPRQFSADCGMAITVNDIARVRDLLDLDAYGVEAVKPVPA